MLLTGCLPRGVRLKDREFAALASELRNAASLLTGATQNMFMRDTIENTGSHQHMNGVVVMCHLAFKKV